MKKFFVSLVMLLSTSAACVFAQSSLIATLSHDGEVTVFYGASALQQAHEAAVHGDVITLSSGSFTSVNISKAITLRGAGMQVDTVNNVLPTIITGDFSISIADDTSERLTIEGIFHNDGITSLGILSGARFIKSRLGGIHASYLINASFLHCKIVDFVTFNNDCDAVFNNCYVVNVLPNSSSGQFFNCILFNPTHNLRSLHNISLYNCFLIGSSDSVLDRLPSSCVAYYCTGVNCADNCFESVALANQVGQSTFTETFKDFTGTYHDEITFELTDGAKGWLGTDGTQRGIYGGNFPYDPTTTNPHITKCNVAAKSTADGKLSVDIEVAGLE